MVEQTSIRVLPRLWQNIQIEKGWEDALEAVLRERLNSAQLERLEDGRMGGRSASGKMRRCSSHSAGIGRGARGASRKDGGQRDQEAVLIPLQRFGN